MKNRITVTRHRKSIRLKGYDYTREGLYFITICTKNRQHYFGEISRGEMLLTEPGRRAETFLKRWCNKNGYEFFQWQSRFYDHIIRNEKSHSKIVTYIGNNPGKWEKDKFHLK